MILFACVMSVTIKKPKKFISALIEINLRKYIRLNAGDSYRFAEICTNVNKVGATTFHSSALPECKSSDQQIYYSNRRFFYQQFSIRMKVLSKRRW